MVEAGGISEGGRATAGEDMEGAMADCGGRGTGGCAAAEAVAAAKNGGRGDLPPPPDPSPVRLEGEAAVLVAPSPSTPGEGPPGSGGVAGADRPSTIIDASPPPESA